MISPSTRIGLPTASESKPTPSWFAQYKVPSCAAVGSNTSVTPLLVEEPRKSAHCAGIDGSMAGLAAAGFSVQTMVTAPPPSVSVTG